MGKKIQLEINVPTRLSDVPFGQYQKYMEVLQGIDEKTEEASEFLSLKSLEIFCGLKLSDVYSIPMKYFDEYLNQIAEVLTEDTPLVHRFWFKGSNGEEVEFGMIPDIQNISFGEHIDVENNILDWKSAHKAMAVLFRPIVAQRKDMYEIEPYDASGKYDEYMKHMPTSVALGAILFFYRLGMKLSKHMIASSLKQMDPKQRSAAEKMFSDKSGVGINQFMLSLEETYSSLMKLPANHLRNALHG